MQDELARYSCQLMLPGFGAQAQQALQRSKVLIVGMGGLGCPAALYLASSGIGTLGIADHDVIGVSNLHRQVLYVEADKGRKKVEVAKARLQDQNPGILVVSHDVEVTPVNVAGLLADYDLVIDATDNFETHYLLNDACVLAGKPLVHGAVYQYEGHVAVWNMKHEDGSFSPNYRDVFPDVDPLQVPDCAEGGVLPTLTGIIGCMQANEAIKIITMPHEVLKGQLLMFDARSMQSRIVRIGEITKTNISGLPEWATVSVVSRASLKYLIKDGTTILIDVRTEEEHSAFNIGGKNIPMSFISAHLQEFDSDNCVVFYCASGKRSLRAAKWVKQQLPLGRIFSLDGGIRDWHEGQG
jgi:molybdopterin/thiamine biosynthesis adenylyltransferase/rhodanese-related sulfurtransferase